jgi:hypothetical protein
MRLACFSSENTEPVTEQQILTEVESVVKNHLGDKYSPEDVGVAINAVYRAIENAVDDGIRIAHHSFHDGKWVATATIGVSFCDISLSEKVIL